MGSVRSQRGDFHAEGRQPVTQEEVRVLGDAGVH